MILLTQIPITGRGAFRGASRSPQR